MEKIKGVLIDIDNKKVSTEEIEDDFRVIQCIINADIFTIARRKIGQYVYAILCDDEGMLKPNAYKRISALCVDGSDMLVGNLFICKEKGPDLVSLTDAQIVQVNLAIRKNSYDDSPVLILG